LCDGFPDGRFQEIAAEDTEPRRCVVSRWFFHQASYSDRPAGWTHRRAIDSDDTETHYIGWLDFPNGNNASAHLFVCAYYLARDRLTVHHNYIGKQNNKGLVSHEWPSAGNCVSKTQRVPLMNVLQIHKFRHRTEEIG